MAATHGKNTVFKVDNSSASLTDISAKVNHVDLPLQVDSNDTTVFGSNSKTSIAGLKHGTFSIQGIWDATIDAHLAGIEGLATLLNFEYGPAGSGTGMIKQTGLCHLTSFKVTNVNTDVNKFQADFEISGDVTRGVY